MDKSQIIVPKREQKEFDPQTTPSPGTRGHCNLCGFYQDLTDSHVFPRSTGNSSVFRAYGYDATSTGKFENLIPRRFANGISFRTLCADCNNALGGQEDQIVKRLFADVRAALKPSPLIVSDPHWLSTKPIRLFRAILAYVATANDKGPKSRLDDEIISIFKGQKTAKQCAFRVYYWPYTGPWLTMIRDIQISYNFFKDPTWLNVIKFKPLGFAITNRSHLFNLPCLNDYFGKRIDDYGQIPIWRTHIERDIHWPANPGQNGAVLYNSASYSFVAAASWRNIRPRLR